VGREEEARSTERPPAPDDDPHTDIAAAIQRAKTNASPGRYGPPAATAKISKFDLAQALALTTADGEHAPSSSKPPREDDAPFVPGEVEVVGEEEVHSGVPGLESAPPGSKPPSSKAGAKSKPPADEAVNESGVKPAQLAAPKAAGRVSLVILAALIGVVVIAYVYVTTR
jgi:hypothetical protein